MLATLVRTLGSLQLAEDAVQDAALAALRAWPRTGVPEDPRAWLTVTARNKAYDALRREAARPAKETTSGWELPRTAPDPALETIEMLEPESVVGDDLLRLVFTCCHPAIAMPARVALALRTLGGLEVSEIARAFLVPEATMAKRLVRARQKIAQARIPYRVPSDAELPDRLPGVLAFVHLIATEAHAPSSGEEVVRVDLELEAVRLARLLAELMPDEPEVLSLLALLLLTSARRSARTGNGAEPVLLADQDRSLWDHTAIAEGCSLLDRAVRVSGGVAASYQLQAHLAACHCTTPSWQDTDWNRIVALYDLLLTLAANPVVALNRAVAVTERDGPAAGLKALDAIEGLACSHLWHAARADALSRLGREPDAAAELRLSLSLAPTQPDRKLLQARLAGIPSKDGAIR
ncbi:MAG: sigma-70 family RNA polymerase sigma factor [Actinomycetota bacterium]|nr:sigma-70 family RNA polymerase sigma factor [Actinomycetota bacterium]